MVTMTTAAVATKPTKPGPMFWAASPTGAPGTGDGLTEAAYSRNEYTRGALSEKVGGRIHRHATYLRPANRSVSGSVVETEDLIKVKSSQGQALA